jgi:uncharacterized protein
MRDLIRNLKSSDALAQKETISKIWEYFPQVSEIDGDQVHLGDDAAAIKSGNEYLLLAGEGVYPPLLKINPYLAGRISVLTNVNDIYAMGGRPVAIVDVIIGTDDECTKEILRGIRDNASRYGVPVVGGHITQTESVNDFPSSSLSVFILGKAKKLLSSFNARSGDDLVFISNSKGKFVSGFNFWDSSSMLTDVEVAADLELVAETAEEGLADTGKDVSMAGLIGSLLMLLESSSLGAEINIDSIPRPYEVPLAEWMLAFPSFGFILSVVPENTPHVREKFAGAGLTCESIGKVIEGKSVYFVNNKGDKELFWDFHKNSLIGIRETN